MPVEFKHINPIRFRKRTTVNNSTVWPIDDIIDQRLEYFKGEYPVKYYRPHLIGDTIVFQFVVSAITNENIVVTEPDLDTVVIPPTDVSPSGWLLDPVLQYEFTPTKEGVHTFEFEEPDYVSDKIYVASLLKYRKQLVKIQYYNSENDFGAIFISDSGFVFQPTAYFTGLIQAGDMETEKNVFETQRGVLSVQRSTPKNVYTLILSAIHRTQRNLLNRIFSCDNILINDMPVQARNTGRWTNIDKADIGNFQITIEQTGDLDTVLEI